MFQFDHGELSPDKVTLVAPIRNEMFFLPSFLDHYRALGIEQFCFIDDYSDDGSADFVKQQRDSILVRSTYRFGQRLWLRPDITGLTHWGQRAGAAWKGLFPRRFFSDRWCVYADLDEYLLLPPGVKTFRAFFDILDAKAIIAVPGVMVDFYPRSTSELARPLAAGTLSDLLDRYSFYDSKPYLNWQSGSIAPTSRGLSVTGRLLDRMLREASPNGASRHGKHQPHVALEISGKVPIVKWLDGVAYSGSHKLNVPPSTEYILPIMHFKFTASIYAKIKYAVRSNSYAGNSDHYKTLDLILSHLDKSGGCLTDDVSRKYKSRSDFYNDVQRNLHRGV